MKILVLGPASGNSKMSVYLTKRGHTVMQCNRLYSFFDLQIINPDIIICNNYEHIFSKESVSRFNIINIHPAALPRGRSIYPNLWALYKGYTIGVCIYQIDHGIRTGDLLASDYMQHWELDFRLDNPQETLDTFHSHLLRRVENLFYRTWPKIEDGSIISYKQEPGGYQYYRNREQSEDLMSMFPDRWNTSIKLVKMTGEKMREHDADLHFGC